MLSSELFWALLVFVVVTLFTPGPNNTMLMASGLNFGFRRGLPHLFGVALGFARHGACRSASGSARVFQAYPAALHGAQVRGRGLSALSRLADRHGRCRSTQRGQGRGRPITFLEAAAFQWVNPKGWVMAVGAVSTYAAVAAFPLNVLLMAACSARSGSLERHLAGVRLGPEALCSEPARAARHQCDHGAAARRLALADPDGCVAIGKRPRSLPRPEPSSPNPHSACGTVGARLSRVPSLQAFGHRPRYVPHPSSWAGIRNPSHLRSCSEMVYFKASFRERMNGRRQVWSVPKANCTRCCHSLCSIKSPLTLTRPDPTPSNSKNCSSHIGFSRA